jgi:phospholipase C
MDTRREFLKKAALLSGGTALLPLLPPVIQKALAINPEPGTTFYDAEHVVFLMQENRSFDHIFGSLQGVRGFNDPRAIRLANELPVWLQTDQQGNTYCPFRLNTLDSKAAWMGSLPHTWSDQTDARNEGKYDQWLNVKMPRKKDYEGMPLTLGYGVREDFPFYYSLADAFTVCDQHFCSSITGTHPNRYYWMSGSIRDIPSDFTSLAHVYNITDYYKPELGWKTYPERLQEAGVSWRIYQNELSMAGGVADEEWLSNFGTNVLEYFGQYNVLLQSGRIANVEAKRQHVQQLIQTLQAATSGQASGSGQTAASDQASAQKLAAAQKLLANLDTAKATYTTDRYNALSDYQKQLNGRAFTVNSEDPDYHAVSPLQYEEAGAQRSINIPKGDILHQFRQDVEKGQLPTVSWLSAPANFSDHPSVPWFGPWYVSEVMDILLKNPEVWKKTVVILTYDENDGYFDHVPPYVVPHPTQSESGKVSAGIDPRLDFVMKDQQVNPSATKDRIREAPLGLGYRVPMVIVSPWTRGGYVCSEVFDHTSSLQFLEKFLAHKTGKAIPEPNITNWRRTICGDLSSAFRPYNGESIIQPSFIDKTAFIEKVNEAQFKDLPTGFRALSPNEIARAKSAALWDQLPQQEKGIRPSCALPYELYLDGTLEDNSYKLTLKAGKEIFGPQAAGAPFYVYAMKTYRNETLHNRNYAVAAGDFLEDTWEVAAFDGGLYHLRAYGPNGFFREFKGSADNPKLLATVTYEKAGTARLSGNAVISLKNKGSQVQSILVLDRSYGKADHHLMLAPGAQKDVVMDLTESHGWYDFSIAVEGKDDFEERFAGRTETGREGKTDPLIGGVVL